MDIGLVLSIVDHVREHLFLSLFLVFLTLCYRYYTSTFGYFQKRGITYMKPKIIFGNMLPRILGKKSVYEMELDIYAYFKGQPYGGFFAFKRPVLYVFDPDLIKAVMIRDFDHFQDRTSGGPRTPLYFRRNLIYLKGSEWKAVRKITTPTFSLSRIKNMVPLLKLSCNRLIETLKANDHKELDVQKMMRLYTLNVFSSVAFGIKNDSQIFENVEFVKLATTIRQMPPYKRYIVLLLQMLYPEVLNYFEHRLNAASLKGLHEILKVAIAERRASKDKHIDFLQLTLDVADKEEKELSDGEKRIFDENTIHSQIMTFVLAGLDTSGMLLALCIHIFASRPDLQERIRTEINDVSEGKDIDYDVLAKLDYLHAFIQETLRHYTPFPKVDRVVTRPYVLPGTTVPLTVGTLVTIPIYGTHMNPDFYEEPQEFRPERFLDDKMKDSILFIPFGAGPKKCIAYHFALISIKIAIVSLLKTFRFKPCSKTNYPIEFDRRSQAIKPKYGLYVAYEKM